MLLLDDPQETIDAFTDGMNAVAKEVLGRPKRIRQPWFTETTLALCDTRRGLKKTRYVGARDAPDGKFAGYRIPDGTGWHELSGDRIPDTG